MARGKQIEDLAADAFEQLCREHGRVHIDVGTGDGRFVLRHARAHPRTLCVGLDPVADNLGPTAAKARRAPRRGGAPNALFVIASLETPPGPLCGRADRLTVLYPWGALLRGLVQPQPEMLAGLAGLAVPGAQVDLLLNASVFAQAAYSERLELPTLDEEYLDRELEPAYRAAGLRVLERRRLAGADPPYRTTWGQRLTRASRRETLVLRAERIEVPG